MLLVVVITLNDTTSAVVCDPPCENGVCVQNDTCSCSEGFIGATCSDAIVGECEVNLCENGGTCTLVGPSAVCSCREGRTDILCQDGMIIIIIILFISCIL